MIERRSDIGPDGGSTLRHYLRTLWRRKWVALTPFILIPLVTFIASKSQHALYEASADVLVNRQEVATTSLIGQTPALDDPGRTMDTQAMLARVPTVAARTLAAAGVRGKPPRALLDHSVVYPLADVLRFTVDDSDPDLVVRLVGDYARQFVRYRRELDTVGLARTLRELEGQIARLESAGKTGSALYLRLTDRRDQLEALQALRTSNVSVVQTPVAGDAEQVAPRPLRNTAYALAGGAVLGLILAFLWEALATRPRSEPEVEALLGMPCLGRVTLSDPPDRTAPLVVLSDPGGREADAFHTLRTNLELASGDQAARTIMLSSPTEDSTEVATAANLGVALARAGRHVVIVDLDLRESRLSSLFGSGDRPGVTTLVAGEHELPEALVAVPLEGSERRWAETRNHGRPGAEGALHVVCAGPRPTQPAEVLSSSALAAALVEIKNDADVVLVVLPPLLSVPDAAAVSGEVDAILLVVNSRRARRATLAEARRTIDSWPTAKLGFVLTDGRGTLQSGRLSWLARPPARERVSSEERVA